MRKIIGVFGDTVYPDCPDAGEVAPVVNDCICKVLTEKMGHARRFGECWCGTGVNATVAEFRCPRGATPDKEPKV